MCSGRAVRCWVGSAGIVFFSIGSALLGRWCACGSGHCRHGTGVVAWGTCLRMMGDRACGLVLEHLLEVMKFTIWCVVGMITPICEKMMLVWVWGCQLERR